MRDELTLLQEVRADERLPPELEARLRDELLGRMTAAPPRPRRRWVLRIALAAAAIGLVAVAGVLAERGGEPSVAARAYAAIAPSSGVMHFVIQRSDPAYYDEYWIDLAHPRRLRTVATYQGRVESQWVVVTRHIRGGSTRWSGDADTVIFQAARVEPSPVDGSWGWGRGGVQAGQNPMAAYRQLLQTATVRSATETTYKGRDAYELRVQFTPPYDLVGDVWPGDLLTYIVDRGTYYPLETAFKLDYAMGGNMAPVVTRFPMFEILPATSQNLALLNPVRNPPPYPR